MPSSVGQYHPGVPQATPDNVAQEIRRLWDRLNYALSQIDLLRAIPRGTGTTSPESAERVALQAASDPLTRGRAFVAFGESQPVGDPTSVAVAGASNGLTFSGATNALSFVVTSAASFRAAIGAAAATAVGAHTMTLAKITAGGTNGSLSWNADGAITAFVDPT